MKPKLWLCGAMLALSLCVTSAAAGAADDKTTSSSALTPERLRTIWLNLIQCDDDGSSQAHRDMQVLSASPQITVPFLAGKLAPVASVDRKQLDRWVADLDSDNFNTREQATKQLEAMAGRALMVFEEKLQDKNLPLEARNRLQRLLKSAAAAAEGRGLSAEELRAVRAVEVLRSIGTAEANAVLSKLAAGDAGSIVTIAARQAVGKK